MKIAVWNGCHMVGSAVFLNPPLEINCIDERGGFYLHQHREDWFEIFQNGNRVLSAMWTLEMAEKYRDRILDGEQPLELQAEIDKHYRLLGGLAIQNLRRSRIPDLYGDREDSERFSSEDERFQTEQKLNAITEAEKAPKSRKRRK